MYGEKSGTRVRPGTPRGTRAGDPASDFAAPRSEPDFATSAPVPVSSMEQAPVSVGSVGPPSRPESRLVHVPASAGPLGVVEQADRVDARETRANQRRSVISVLVTTVGRCPPDRAVVNSLHRVGRCATPL